MTKEIEANIKEGLKMIPEDYIKDIIPDYDKNKITMFKGMGCTKCGNTGYSGRIAISEVHRVLKKDGRFVIVDLGKPDELFFRTGVSFYLRCSMSLTQTYPEL